MNENTIIGICCYDGDLFRVRRHLPIHITHQAPIILLSPSDAPVLTCDGYICRTAGSVGYIGQHTLDRRTEHHRILLEYPFDYFLIHDSDSICITPEFPRELYADPDVVWSNEVVEPRPHVSLYPKLAFQAPYFLSRSALQRIVDVGPDIPAHPITPYIDWAMVAWTYEAGLRHCTFSSLPGKNVMVHPVKTEEGLAAAYA